MAAIELEDLRLGAIALVDTPPIIYMLEGHLRLAARFRPLFEKHDRGDLTLAVTTVTVAEVLTGALVRRDEALSRRYRAVLESWRVIELSTDIAESAARLRARLRLKLADAIQAASALHVNADVLVTHDRDFDRLKAIRVIS